MKQYITLMKPSQMTRLYILEASILIQQERQFTPNITLKSVCMTNVTAEKH